MSEILFIGNEHAQLTPFHLLVLFLGCLSLIVSQWDLPPPLCQAVGVWRRGMVLVVGGMVMHHIVINALRKYQDDAEAAQQRKKEAIDLKAKGSVPKQPNAWENASAHPSAFLTTRDGKPRLFPFPLGKAGAETKELWWEAGNSAHVGHFCK
ncbi:hypothetical protein EHS25_004190 [Saitozyma podzolica]|uniref:Uncharacterized protein n=1 Tax=Saitozyma podzolica TaxID=1890683 RepID=A0A427YTH8_9TREE|nr:hypothetical protein EHS25_004190 [Saitozyma podzolica]